LASAFAAEFFSGGLGSQIEKGNYGMLDVKDLKVGLTVWWHKNENYRTWSCPGIVTRIEKNFFAVKLLDDFKESFGYLDGPSREEMHVCTPKELQSYIEKRRGEFQRRTTDLQRQLAVATEEATSYDMALEMVMRNASH
jgi:hypothetical protein